MGSLAHLANSSNSWGVNDNSLRPFFTFGFFPAIFDNRECEIFRRKKSGQLTAFCCVGARLAGDTGSAECKVITDDIREALECVVDLDSQVNFDEITRGIVEVCSFVVRDRTAFVGPGFEH